MKTNEASWAGISMASWTGHGASTRYWISQGGNITIANSNTTFPESNVAGYYRQLTLELNDTINEYRPEYFEWHEEDAFVLGFLNDGGLSNATILVTVLDAPFAFL